ncbi:MAG TPA: hypothetical protein VNW92_22960 [Polyangiaceae bacterium]|nr:hypothetical protein [Polyangiaceae bacterium]
MRLLVGSVAAALLGVAGCSLWVSSEPEQIGCTDEGKLGPPACATGFVCAHQACVRCGAREVCGDDLDNDCNGQIDDGCPVGAAAGSSASN